jgi:hypothetical protein
MGKGTLPETERGLEKYKVAKKKERKRTHEQGKQHQRHRSLSLPISLLPSFTS